MSSTIYNPKMKAVNERLVSMPSDSGSDEDSSDKLDQDKAKFYVMVRQGQQVLEDLADLFSSVLTIQSDTGGKAATTKGDQQPVVTSGDNQDDDDDDANSNISTPPGSDPSYLIQDVEPPAYVKVVATKKGRGC